jgi:Spy/CpxP family protein refolding chaperone
VTLVRGVVLTLILSVIAAALGVWGGMTFIEAHARHGTSLHEIVHARLHLTAGQQQRIEALEHDHAAKHEALEVEMRAANADLAQAYQESHAYTPKMQAAIDRFHRASDAQQKETMIHVIAMRAVLTPDQAAQFDDTVVKALTDAGS